MTEKIANLEPVDKLAAMVTRPGIDFIPNKKIVTQESPFPIKTWPVVLEPDYRGYQFGRFTVIGVLFEEGNLIKIGVTRKWVVKCVCGTYAVRRQKSLINPKNHKDRCERCRHLAFLKREDKRRHLINAGHNKYSEEVMEIEL